MEPCKNGTQEGFLSHQPILNHGLSRELKGVLDGLRYKATLGNVNFTISALNR